MSHHEQAEKALPGEPIYYTLTKNGLVKEFTDKSCAHWVTRQDYALLRAQLAAVMVERDKAIHFHTIEYQQRKEAESQRDEANRQLADLLDGAQAVALADATHRAEQAESRAARAGEEMKERCAKVCDELAAPHRHSAASKSAYSNGFYFYSALVIAANRIRSLKGQDMDISEKVKG